MSFSCPSCFTYIDLSQEPDYLSEMTNNRFTYECECGAQFEVHVDWDPIFHVLTDTLRRPMP